MKLLMMLMRSSPELLSDLAWSMGGQLQKKQILQSLLNYLHFHKNTSCCNHYPRSGLGCTIESSNLSSNLKS